MRKHLKWIKVEVIFRFWLYYCKHLCSFYYINIYVVVWISNIFHFYRDQKTSARGKVGFKKIKTQRLLQDFRSRQECINRWNQESIQKEGSCSSSWLVVTYSVSYTTFLCFISPVAGILLKSVGLVILLNCLKYYFTITVRAL